MATLTLFLRGDQIATYVNFSGTGNGTGRIVTVNGVTAIGPASQIYTVTVEQVNGGGTEFQNGQFVTIATANGTIIMPRSAVNPDEEQGMSAGDEHLLISQQPFLIDLGGVPIVPSTVLYGQADQAANPGVGDNDGNLDFLDFPCFTPGTMIQTPGGPRDVADLVVGDLVTTLDHGPKPIIWAGHRTLTFNEASHPRQPILFTKGCLGNSLPAENLRVSPQHRMLFCGPDVQELFGLEQVFVLAKGLLDLPGVRQMHGKKKETYISILLDQHAVLTANDCLTESFYPGKMGLQMLGRAMRSEVLDLLPLLADDQGAGYGPLARRALTMRQARQLTTALNTRSFDYQDVSRPQRNVLRLVG